MIGSDSGTVSGAMNMMGGIAGGISPLVVGYLLAWTSQGWIVTFYVSAAIYMMGALLLAFSRHAHLDRGPRLGPACRLTPAATSVHRLGRDVCNRASTLPESQQEVIEKLERRALTSRFCMQPARFCMSK